MAYRLKIDIGAIEANNDANFKNNFIVLYNLQNTLNGNSCIIYGLKGTGKTALCRAITEQHSNLFLATKVIDLGNTSFQQIHSVLSALSKTTNKKIINLSIKIWLNVLLLYSLKTYADTLPDDDNLKSEITDLVDKKLHPSQETNNGLYSFLVNLIIKIKELGFDYDEETPSGLTQSQRVEINKTFDDEVYQLIIKCSKRFTNETKKILLCLDGFESIISHNNKLRKGIFSGLADAIYKCTKDKLINKHFCFKAFLPKEITEEVRTIHFNTENIFFNNQILTWNNYDLKELLKKRLAPFSKTRNNNFDDIWIEHLPKKIYNSFHLVEENTFDYILRHSMYRPRYLLIHVQSIFDQLEFQNRSQKADSAFIRKTVSKTNLVLADLIATELEYTIKGIKEFLASLNIVSCTMDFSYFKDQMKRTFHLKSIEAERALFDKLYNIGIIGYFKRSEFKYKDLNSIGCHFSYSSEQPNRWIYNMMDNDDIIVLSPLFKEYCGCKGSKYGYIF